MTLEQEIKSIIKEVPDFPKPGISFKDITPLLAEPKVYNKALQALTIKAKALQPDYIVGIESRGFLFGFALAKELGVPFVPLRKPGKLPREVFSASYSLEYGEATLELHKGDLKSGSKVIIHDDLLATGGTAGAAIDLIQTAGCTTAGLLFLVELSFLKSTWSFDKNLPLESLVRY